MPFLRKLLNKFIVTRKQISSRTNINQSHGVVGTLQKRIVMVIFFAITNFSFWPYTNSDLKNISAIPKLNKFLVS